MNYLAIPNSSVAAGKHDLTGFHLKFFEPETIEALTAVKKTKLLFCSFFKNNI
jgi:hypothetical protein